MPTFFIDSVTRLLFISKKQLNRNNLFKSDHPHVFIPLPSPTVIIKMIKIDYEKLKELEGKKFRKTLILIPDGLKPKFREILKEIEKYIDSEQIWIWFNSNYGSCDVLDLDFDLIINIGHSDLFFKYYPNKKFF